MSSITYGLFLIISTVFTPYSLYTCVTFSMLKLYFFKYSKILKNSLFSLYSCDISFALFLLIPCTCASFSGDSYITSNASFPKCFYYPLCCFFSEPLLKLLMISIQVFVPLLLVLLFHML